MIKKSALWFSHTLTLLPCLFRIKKSALVLKHNRNAKNQFLQSLYYLHGRSIWFCRRSSLWMRILWRLNHDGIEYWKQCDRSKKTQSSTEESSEAVCGPNATVQDAIDISFMKYELNLSNKNWSICKLFIFCSEKLLWQRDYEITPEQKHI